MTVTPCPEGETRVEADVGLLRRVFTNIVANAIKFTSDRDGRITVSFRPQHDSVRVEIDDNGPGIPGEWHEKIFEKFGQVGMRSERKKYTTGLGLTFCKLAVEAHGGAVGVRSTVGLGTTFWFTVPYGSARPMEVVAAKAQPAP